MMKRALFELLLVVLTVLTLTPDFVFAGKDTDRDIMLVLDNSGSMQQNDPGFLTKKVVSDFVAGLPSSAQAGIVIFDERVKMSVPLSPLTRDEARRKITSSLSKVTFSGKLTDTPAGIERAMYELKSRGRKGASKVIIFLTDGIVDTGDKIRDVERAKWLREDLGAESEKLGIRIFGIAFTDKADFQLIQALGERTGGGYFRAATAADISGIFKEIDTELKHPPVKSTKGAAGSGSSMIWIMVIVGIAALGIGAIIWGKGRKRPTTAGVDITPRDVGLPNAVLRDVQGITGKQEYPITTSSFSIGRAATNEVVIDKQTISSKHATIDFRGSAFYLLDLRSANGTTLNGQKVTAEFKLKNDDRIGFDQYEFVFVQEGSIDETKNQLAEVDRTVTAPSRATGPEASPPEDELPASR